MKTEHLILLAVGLYWLYSRSGTASGWAAPLTPHPYPLQSYPGGASRSTGSGGTTASGGPGMGTSVNNPPVGAQAGNPQWGTPAGYITCPDGTMVNDPTLCPSGSGYFTCSDGTVVNDPSLCPAPVDTMDPCDPNSMAYDPTQCGTAMGDYGYTPMGFAPSNGISDVSSGGSGGEGIAYDGLMGEGY
jgi:hypothetical protein